MSDHENTDAWSSEGDSVSSESVISSDSEFLTPRDHKGIRHLRCTGAVENSELLDHAIDRWTAYGRLCDRSIASLRDTMVDSYVKEAIEAKFHQNFTKNDSADSAGKLSSLPNDSKHKSKPVYRCNQRLTELSALRRIGHPSKRAGNARHTAATTRFAIFSCNLAPWRPMGTSQKCQYRDPTISTWEYKCCKASIPLLPYCPEHLVLVKEPVITPSSQSHSQQQNQATPVSPIPVATGQSESVVGIESGVIIPQQQQALPSSPTSVITETSTSDRMGALSPIGKGKLECGKPQKPTSKKSTLTKSRTGGDGIAGQSEIQFTPQHLFRKCGGGPNNDCSQPVINWTDSTRCHLHTTFSTLFTPSVKKEEDGTSQMDSPDSSPMHPFLKKYLSTKGAADDK